MAGTTFVVRVSLNNPATSAKAVTVTATLSGLVAGVTANASASKTISGAGYIDFLITIAAGTASQSLSITATVAGTEEISARVLSAGPSSGLGITIKAQAALAITIFTWCTGNQTYVAGTTLRVRVSLSNPATSAKALTVTAPLTFGGATGISSNASASKTISGNGYIDFLITIAAGAPSQPTVTITTTVAGTEEITSRALGPLTSNLVVAIKAQAALAITGAPTFQTGNGTYVAGTTLVLRVSLTNNPATNAKALTVTATLGGLVAGVTSNASASKTILGTGYINFQITIAAGVASQSLSITATVSGSEEITARALSAGPSAALNVTIKAQAALAITNITALTGNGTYQRGQTFIIKINFINTGGATAINVAAIPTFGGYGYLSANMSGSISILAGGTGFIKFLISVAGGAEARDPVTISATWIGFEEISSRALSGNSGSNNLNVTIEGPPSAPQTLTAIPGSNQVVLNWTAPASDGSSAITNYSVYVGTAPGGETLNTTVGAVLTCTVTNLHDGQVYYFQVSAMNAFGEGPRSIEIGAGSGTPSAPQSLSTTAGNSQVVLNWTTPASNGGSVITGYNVYRGLTSGSETLLIGLGVVLTYTNTGLTNGQQYYYKVAAVNVNGAGVNSTEESATPCTIASAPQNLVATPGNGFIVLNWLAPANNGGSLITNYHILQSMVPAGFNPLAPETVVTLVGNVTTYTVTNLTNGQTYYYKVEALNAAGWGIQSNMASATPATVPSAPQSFSATAGNAQVVLNWAAPVSNGGSAITGYNVYSGTASGCETLLASFGTVLTYTATGLTNGQVYYFKVCAVNSQGNGSNATETSATPFSTYTIRVVNPMNTTYTNQFIIPLSYSQNRTASSITYRLDGTWTIPGTDTALNTSSYVNSSSFYNYPHRIQLVVVDMMNQTFFSPVIWFTIRIQNITGAEVTIMLEGDPKADNIYLVKMKVENTGLVTLAGLTIFVSMDPANGHITSDPIFKAGNSQISPGGKRTFTFQIYVTDPSENIILTLRVIAEGYDSSVQLPVVVPGNGFDIIIVFMLVAVAGFVAVAGAVRYKKQVAIKAKQALVAKERAVTKPSICKLPQSRTLRVFHSRSGLQSDVFFGSQFRRRIESPSLGAYDTVDTSVDRCLICKQELAGDVFICPVCKNAKYHHACAEHLMINDESCLYCQKPLISEDIRLELEIDRFSLDDLSKLIENKDREFKEGKITRQEYLGIIGKYETEKKNLEQLIASKISGKSGKTTSQNPDTEKIQTVSTDIIQEKIVTIFEPELLQKLQSMQLSPEIYEEVVGRLKNIPPEKRLGYLEQIFKENERFDENF
nr:fibronectin type III domain-containing protein [Candidatus Sigynarchaeota archaeon]